MADFATSTIKKALDAKGYRDDSELRPFLAEVLNQVEELDLSTIPYYGIRGMVALAIAQAVSSILARQP